MTIPLFTHLRSVFLIFFAANCSTCNVQTDVNFRDKEIRKLNERIIGGQPYEGMPAVVALTRDGRAHCTATIVAPKRAITAHHCVYGVPLSSLQLVFASDITSPSALKIGVVAAKSHPKAILSNYEITNDVAYVTLATSAPVESMLMRKSPVSVGEELFLVGYGVENGNMQIGAGRKRAAWSKISEITLDKIFYGGSAVNTCNGDSGGPAFTRASDGTYEIAGITSYGDYYCQKYGADMRVDYYYNFLSKDLGPIGSVEIDPCDGFTAQKVCTGDNVLSWCENSVKKTYDCKKKWGEFGSCYGEKCWILGVFEHNPSEID